jgi:hypothetical protein
MSNQAAGGQTASPLYRWERVIASLTVAWVMGLTTYMIFQEHALSNTSVYFLKIVLSLSGGVMLATLPGFFDINYTFGGLSVRAAGGAAAFIFIYTQSPALPALQNAQDGAPARAHPYREAPKPDKSSMLGTAGFPVLMALSISPAGFIPSEASYQQQSIVQVNGSGGDRPGGERISIGEAVSRDMQALGGAVASYAGKALGMAKHWLDKAASLLRIAVDRTSGVVRDLLGLGLDGDHPRLAGVYGEDAADGRLDDVTGALLTSDDGLLVSLTASLTETTTSLVGGLTQTVGGLVATTDKTVTGLVTGLQGTTGTLLATTDTLVSGVTGLLDDTAGGLTGNLTAPVEKLADGLTDTTGRIVDTVLPAAARTTSAVLTNVDAGLGTITATLNEISPAIVSKLDPDFMAAQDPSHLDHVTSALRGPLFDDGVVPTVAALPERVLGGLSEGPLLGGGRLQLGRGLDESGPACVSGCGGPLGGTVSGLRDTVGGLNRTVGGLAGGLAGGDQGGRGLLGNPGGGDGGGAGAAGGLGGEAGRGGGLVGNTLQATGSAVGGTLKSLKRR